MRHGAQIDPPNRFEQTRCEADLEQLAWDDEHLRTRALHPVEYLPDAAQSIVSQNDSPDIPFRYSVNPYRGCQHGCAYCYARPTHEYLGLGAGLDFETKILVKHDAAALLRKFLSRPAWQCETITFSGVTDCYQPAERTYQLTRACLQVALEFQQPVSIITKNALVLRDLDLLRPLAEQQLVHVYVSVTTLDAELARDLEPRTSIPAARLRAIRGLADSGVPVGVMTAPVIPGLTDSELPAILEAAATAGAQAAGYVMLRLPLTVQPVFLAWLERMRPDARPRIEAAIRALRGGALSSAQFGARLADQIRQMFRTFSQKHGLDRKLPPHDCTRYGRPEIDDGQRRLF